MMGTQYECFLVRTAAGMRKQFFKNGKAVRSKHVPQTVKSQLKCTGGHVIKYGALELAGGYTRAMNQRMCPSGGVKPLDRPKLSVNNCYISQQDYLDFLKLVMEDQYKRQYPNAAFAPYTLQQYVAKVEKQVLAQHIPPKLQTNVCTKLTAFMPQASDTLPAQGNFREHMPAFAHIPSETKTRPYWQIVKKLGQGAYGIVYLVSNSAGANFALKVHIENPTTRRTSFMTLNEEVLMHRFFERLNLAPRIFGESSLKLDDGGNTTVKVFVMEPVDFTLQDLICNPAMLPGNWAPAVAEQLKQMLLKLNKYGITHGDFHAGNIGFDYDPAQKKMKMILLDFGQASNSKNYPTVDAIQLLSSIKHVWNASGDIVRVIENKVREALKSINNNKPWNYGPDTRDNFIQMHRTYEQKGLGYKSRTPPPADPNFPRYFSP